MQEGVLWPHRTPLHYLPPGSSPKPSHGGSIAGFWPPNPPPSSFCQTQDHAAAATSSTPSHHLAPSLPTAISNGAPEIEPSRSILWVLCQTPSPPLVLPIGRAHHNQHHHYITPLPFSTVPCCRFTRRARTRSTTVRFRVLAQTPSPALRFANAQHHHHHHLIRTTSPHPPITLRCRS